jgi:hypothetical protein
MTLDIYTPPAPFHRKHHDAILNPASDQWIFSTLCHIVEKKDGPMLTNHPPRFVENLNRIASQVFAKNQGIFGRKCPKEE